MLRAIVDKLPAMVAYWDKDLRCRFANRDYERWFGVDPDAMIGRDMEEFLGPLFALNLPYIQGALRGEEQLFEREIPDPAGGPSRHSQAHYIPDIADGSVQGFCVLVVDITRRKRAEEALIRVERQLRATEQTAALATLAGGLAHEINNPLAAVLANLEITLRGMQAHDRAPLNAGLLDAYEGAKRVSAIVQSMKLLARSETTSREPVDVNQTLEQSIDAAANVVRYRACLVRDFGDVGCVEANRSQLAQVFVNLLINAAQALKEDGGERNEIRVRTRREADDVVIEVEDNGAGVSAEVFPHIFEPFFTTKDVGVGMGLGLSISNTIINALGGTLSATSSVGVGSVFRVTLPAAVQAAVAQAPHHDEAVTQRSLEPVAQSTARIRVLIVDDDEGIRRLLRRALGQDYELTIASSGREALTALSTDELGFDVILCDLMMPEMTGAEVYAEVLRLHPALAHRFVFMTGGSFTTSGRAFLDSVSAPVLDKPFNFAQVAAVIGQAASKNHD